VAETVLSGARVTGASVALVLLTLYVVTLCPTIYSGDAAELATAGATFGIAHPPGYPLYTLLANAVSRLLLFGEVAWRINLMSALSATGAALLLYGFLLRLGISRALATFAALALGTGATFWSQALISEVYAFDALLLACALYLGLRAGQGDSRGLSAAALAWLGFSVVHRTVNVIYAPSVLILAWPALKAHARSWPGRAALLGALLAPLLTLLYLPIASSFDPMLDTGDPDNLSRFLEVVLAKVYRQYLFAGPPGAFLGQLGEILAGFPRDLGVALPLAPLGAALWFRRERGVVCALIYVVVANLIFASNYHVDDVSVFVLPAIVALCALAGMGVAACTRWIPGLYLSVILLMCVSVSGWLNAGENNLRGQTLSRDFGRDALSYPEEGGVVLSHVDSVSYALWYVQYVEKRRPDLLVVAKGRAVHWHQEQARRLRPDLDIPRYDGADAANRWPAMVTERNADAVPVYVTANLIGYFGPREALRLSPVFVETPAGLMTQLAPRSAVPSPAVVVARNEAFWREAWPHALRARAQHLGSDMTALLLHYASMRVLFARYCLWHGKAEAASRAARDVERLNTAPLIEAVNRLYIRRGARYHLSDMPQVAAMLERLAAALQEGELTLLQVRQQLAPRRRE
jgi:hypothetical protein